MKEELPTIVCLSGEYDFARRDELDQVLDRYGDADPLVLDLNECERLDTGAVRSLVRFQRARREAGKTPLVLSRPKGRVREFLVIASLSDTFTIRDEV